MTGSYTLFFEPQFDSSGGQLSAQFHTFADITGTITADAPTNVTTTVPGQTVSLAFQATAGKRVTVSLWSGGFAGEGTNTSWSGAGTWTRVLSQSTVLDVRGGLN